MDWLLSSLIATLANTALIFLLTFLLYWQYGRKHLLYWSGCWGLYGITLALQLVYNLASLHWWFIQATSHQFLIASTWLCLLGTSDFVKQRLAPFWKLLALLATIWLWAGWLVGMPPLAVELPVFLEVSATMAGAGRLMLARGRSPLHGHGLAGWSLVLIALHLADYPFLKDIPWFAPWGFLIATALIIAVSLGFLLAFFQRLQRELKETHATLSSILKVVPVGVALIRNGTILWANDNFHQLLNRPPGSLINQSGIPFLSSPQELQRIAVTLGGYMQNGGCGSMEITVFPHQAPPLPCQLLARYLDPQHPEQGQIIALVDRSLLEQAEERLQQLAAGVAHNFNNVLMGVISNAQAAQQLMRHPRPSQAQVTRLLENVILAASTGRDVARRLAASASPHGSPPPARETLDLSEVVRAALRIARLTFTPAQDGSISFDIHLEAGMRVKGSWGELVEVIINLVGNAVDAMPQGGVIQITGWREKDQALLRIKDSGLGMDQQTCQRIFAPFFTTKGARGRGLGLTTSLGIIRSHGGEINVSSRPNQGSSFTLRLPLSPEPRPDGAAPVRPNRVQEVDILLVEDESLVAMGMENLLAQAGHRVHLASNVAQAEEILADKPVDLVLCDFTLPDGTAWDVAALLHRQGGSPSSIPFLILTGWSHSELPIPRPEELPPPAGIIQKPVDKAALLGAVSEALGTQKLRRTD